MFEALLRAMEQLPRREMRAALWRTLVWTIVLCAIAAASAYQLLAKVAADLGEYGSVVMAAGLFGILILLWFLFGIVENAILFCYAERIVNAVEARYYPALPPTRGIGWGDSIWSGVRLLLLTILLNILALPVYLLAPGANLVLFLALNGYLLGRAYFDAVALRRLDDRSASIVWRAEQPGFVVNGMISTALLTVPVVNLVVPIVGLAAAVHLFQAARQRGVVTNVATEIGE